MATAEEYAQWITANKDRRGTPEFDKVVNAYKLARNPAQNDEQALLQEQLNAMDPPAAPAPPQETTFQQEALGALETGATLATGATTGTLGMLAGTLQQLSKEILSGGYGTYAGAERVARAAQEKAAEYTYTPRTETAQRNLEVISEVAEPLVALTPLAPELAAATRPAAAVTRAVLPETKRLTSTAPATPPPGSVGAAGVPISDTRRGLAQELGFEGRAALTKGQETRRPEALKFEVETAKQPELGLPLRERYAAQREQVISVVDEFIDSTGAELGEGNLRGIGELVDRTLISRRARDKAKIRALYKEAEKKGELADPADLNPLAEYLNSNRAERAENGIMQKVQRQIDTLEVGQGSFEDGSLQLRPMTLNEAEAIRRFINRNTNQADANDVRIATALKQTIDESTEGLGGEFYKRARKARFKFAQDYENSYLVKRLLGTKAGTEDRAIAMEDVFKNVVISPSTSVDQLRHVRRLLQTKTGGEAGVGAQAWREIQAQTVRHLRDQLDPSGRGEALASRNFQKAVGTLDKSGKLDYLFGKAGAEKLRTLDEVVQYIATVPPDAAINYSNTAATLTGLVDVVLSGATSTPLPLATGVRFITKHVKDAKLKAKIREHLSENPER